MVTFPEARANLARHLGADGIQHHVSTDGVDAGDAWIAFDGWGESAAGPLVQAIGGHVFSVDKTTGEVSSVSGLDVAYSGWPRIRHIVGGDGGTVETVDEDDEADFLSIL